MRKNRWMGLLLGTGLTLSALTGCGAAKDGGTQVEKTDTAEGAGVGTDIEKDMYGAESSAGQAQQDSAPKEGVGEVDLKGYSLSILGDSISTFDGWIPENCAVFFPESGEVTDVSQTWWVRLMDSTGMELCANGSSSGSTCVGDSLSIDNPKYGCSDYRISLLAGAQGKMPDIIIVYMGTNDLLVGAPIGDNDGTKMVTEGEVDNFSDAYSLMLDKLASSYPISTVYCCSLAPVGDWGTDQPFVTFVNSLGLTAEDYSERIRIIAENKGAEVIDLYHCGVEIDNLSEMTTDGVHLTPEGMECIAAAMESVLRQ